MHRSIMLPVLMISLLLTGCGSAAPEQKIEQQFSAYAAAEELSFTADITARLDDEFFQCTLLCERSEDGTTVEVLAPELIAGVKAQIKDGEASVEYEDIILSVGTAGLDGLQPVSAVPFLMDALKGGHVIRTWTEKDGDTPLLAAQIYAGDLADVTIWFDAGTLTPWHAELSQDGAVVISCEIREFKLG